MKRMVYPIQIKDTREAIKICKEAATADLGVTVSCGTIIIDPRSMLGLMALVGKKVLIVAPDHSNPDRFTEFIKRIS
jgi:hypothetical protein